MLSKNLQKGAQMTEDQQVIAIGTHNFFIWSQKVRSWSLNMLNLRFWLWTWAQSSIEAILVIEHRLVILWAFVSTKQQHFPVWCSLGRLGLVFWNLGASAATTASLSSELGTWSTGQGRIATPQDMDHVSCLHRTTPKPDRDGSSWWLKHPVQKYAVQIDVKLDHLKLASQRLRNKKKDLNPPPPTTVVDCPITKKDWEIQKISLWGCPNSRG